MDQLVEFLYPVALLLVPLTTFWRMTQRPQATRRSVLIGTALAGSGVGVGVAGFLALEGAPFEAVMAVWPWVFLSAGVGLVIGILGLVARSAGNWLSGSP
jgi:hypothetical protein